MGSHHPASAPTTAPRHIVEMTGSLLLILALGVAGIAAQHFRDLLVVSQLREEDTRKAKNSDLSWFPAEVKSDCDDVDESQVELRQGRPSLSCKVDEERFCLCGKVGSGEEAAWRFLCGTCKISFKLDRVKSERRKADGRGIGRPTTRNVLEIQQE